MLNGFHQSGILALARCHYLECLGKLALRFDELAAQRHQQLACSILSCLTTTAPAIVVVSINGVIILARCGANARKTISALASRRTRCVAIGEILLRVHRR